jgi:asparagine synthase (glutamine-hydrolysing)
MSAITVIYNLNKRPVERSDKQIVLDGLDHRGGDDQGMWIDGYVGLGHQMRWTTPESLHEKLPLKSPESLSVITCDARIDNRDELIGQLSFSNKPVDEITDSEIILKAYDQWGEDCLPRLIGDFVFAIWNERERKLFCARDPLGIKHFYYLYKPGELFALASEIKALLKIGNVPCELDEEGLADYLVINTEDKEITFYKHIKRLPHSQALSVSENGLRIWEYWRPKSKEIKLRNNIEYQEVFREKLAGAVECRVRSAFPIGSTLSGGLDSSAVVCLASRHLKDKGMPPLHTFSGVFPTVSKLDPRIDEIQYMQSVINRAGCQPHFVNADNVSPLHNMEKIISHADHPVGYVNLYMVSEIYKAAQRENVRILLTGHDGDCTVSYGYEDFELLARRGRYFRLVREALALKKNMPSTAHTLKRLAWHQGIKPTIPSPLINIWRTLRRRKSEDYTDSSINFPLHLDSVNQDFRKRHELKERIIRYQKSSYPDGLSGNQYHWRVLTNGLTAIMLELNENLSAAFGIEQRHPFYDRRLVEFCINLPPGQRLYKGWTRSIFRFAMQDILPPDVQWRTNKANLGAHVKINLFKYKSAAMEIFSKQSLKKLEKYIDIEKLRNAYRSCLSKPNKKDAEVMLLLTSVYLLNWLEQSGFANE